MTKHSLTFELRSITELGARNYLLDLSLPDSEGDFPDLSPGQFVQVQVPSRDVLLRRPISICDADPLNRLLTLLVARVGRGTAALTSLLPEASLNLLLPLGNTFGTENVHRPLLIGGGVGVAPMLFLAKEFASLGIRPQILLGGRTAAHIALKEAFEALGDVYYTTESGDLGLQGRVTDHPACLTGDYDKVYTCGPRAMMLAVAKVAEGRGIPCEVSLENMMACGIGACLCCVENLVDRGNTCVCTDGPIFDSRLIKKD